MSVDKALWLMVSIRDRALIGKHDTVGRAYICLDPRIFGDLMVHDQWLDLDSQGRILLRISMEGEKDDIQFYFGRAFRSLKRGEGDMVRIFIDKVGPFPPLAHPIALIRSVQMSPLIRQNLSRPVLKTLVKTGNSGLDYNKALGNVTALYRSAIGGGSADPQIPLPSSEKPRIKPEELTDVEIEQAILPLFDYFDANLPTLNTYLSDATKEMVMTRLWKEILTIIEGLLIPPLSEAPSDMKPLSDKEVDIAFKWLKVSSLDSVSIAQLHDLMPVAQFLRDYFYAEGEGPIPLETLQNQKYRDVVSIRLYYDWHTYVVLSLYLSRCSPLSGRQRRAHGGMRAHDAANPARAAVHEEARQERVLATKPGDHQGSQAGEEAREGGQQRGDDYAHTADAVRDFFFDFFFARLSSSATADDACRPNTSDFIAQQLQIMVTMRTEQEQREREKQTRKLQRPKHVSQVPEVPPLPEIPAASS